MCIYIYIELKYSDRYIYRIQLSGNRDVWEFFIKETCAKKISSQDPRFHFIHFFKYGWKRTTTAIQKTSQNRDPNIKVEIASRKLTVRPWQSSGLEDEFPLQSGDFQGQTVNLLEGNTSNDV